MFKSIYAFYNKDIIDKDLKKFKNKLKKQDIVLRGALRRYKKDYWDGVLYDCGFNSFKTVFNTCVDAEELRNEIKEKSLKNKKICREEYTKIDEYDLKHLPSKIESDEEDYYINSEDDTITNYLNKIGNLIKLHSICNYPTNNMKIKMINMIDRLKLIHKEIYNSFGHESSTI